jgi:hypothetical protein
MPRRGVTFAGGAQFLACGRANPVAFVETVVLGKPKGTDARSWPNGCDFLVFE